MGLGGTAPSIVPVTVLTGCLGAGKTTVIRALLRQLPPGYTCAWLKNEYGDAGVDRMVAQVEARVSGQIEQAIEQAAAEKAAAEAEAARLREQLRALQAAGPSSAGAKRGAAAGGKEAPAAKRRSTDRTEA